jgi:AmmeMemoRadiSam system protein B
MPYIYKIFGSDAKIIPIIVGHNDEQLTEEYGKIFAPYFNKHNTLFIISSDFCHWGAHFAYQPLQQGLPIWKHIENLDQQAIKLIEQNNIDGFRKYLDETGNTICGR